MSNLPAVRPSYSARRPHETPRSAPNALLRGGEAALTNQLRRIARSAGVEFSISDTPEELCENLLAKAPKRLTEQLTTSMMNPTPMMNPRLSSGAPSASAPNTPRRVERSAAFLTEASLDSLAGPSKGSATPNIGSVSVLGASDTPIIPVNKYLQEAHPREGVLPPDHSKVLSCVIASAERLEMEFAHAAVVATTDAARAIDAARLESLHAHVRSLKAVQEHCWIMQRDAEAKSDKFLREIDALKTKSKHERQEVQRLRFQLAKQSALAGGSKAEATVMAAFGGGKKRGGGLGLLEQMEAASEREAWQLQLDEASKESDKAAAKVNEANLLADDISAQLAKEKAERAKERHDGEQQLAQAKLDREQLKRQAAEAQKRHEQELARTKALLSKSRTAMKLTRAAAASMAPKGARVPSGGSVGPGGEILDANGNPVLGEDGEPLMATPPGGRIGPDGAILDANGKPVLGADGKPLVARQGTSLAVGSRSPVPPGGSIGPGGVVLDKDGKPVLGEDGKPLVVCYPRVPPGGSIREDGVILDAKGRPLVGKDGKPIYADPRVPPGGSIAADGRILDANGKPVLRADGTPLFADPTHPPGGVIGPDGSVLSVDFGVNAGDSVHGSKVPKGGSIGAGGQVLDADGNPVLGADGKPLVVTDQRVPPGGSIGPGGVILTADGKPVLGKDGRPLISDPRIPANGSVSDDGMILDADGQPVLGHDGKPVYVGGAPGFIQATYKPIQVPPGGSIGPGGIVLDKDGKPVLGADGQPLVLSDPRVPPGGSIGPGGVVLDANGNLIEPTIIIDPRIPPGGCIGLGGAILDAEGHPVLDADGNPLFADAAAAAASGYTIIPPGGSVGKNGVVLDKDGNPVLGADGQPLRVGDPRMPKGGSIGEGGVIYDANGKPVLDEDGQPLVADGRPPHKPIVKSGTGLGRPKVARNSPVVAAGRMVSLSKLRCRDVPNMDRGSRNKNNVSDPYLTFQVLDDKNEDVDFARTPHLENMVHPKWEDDVRLFIPDDDPKGSRTAPVAILIKLWDHDKGGRETDDIIGEVKVSIKVGSGKVKVEVPSRSVSSLRPYLYFKYDATPQMFFEQKEFDRVTHEEFSKVAPPPSEEDPYDED